MQLNTLGLLSVPADKLKDWHQHVDGPHLENCLRIYTLIWTFCLILLRTHSWSLSNHVYVCNILPDHITKQTVAAATFVLSRCHEWILEGTSATLTNVVCDNRPLVSTSQYLIFLYHDQEPNTLHCIVFSFPLGTACQVLCPHCIDHSDKLGENYLQRMVLHTYCNYEHSLSQYQHL